MTIIFAAEQVAQRPDLSIILAHTVFYVGVVALLGIATSVFAFEQTPKRLIRVVPWAWVTATAGALAIGEIRRRALGTDLGDFVGTTLGRAALIRMLGLAISYVGMIVAIRRPGGARRAGSIVTGLGAAISAFGHVQSSHAAAGGWTWFKLAEQGVHIIAVGAWIGGLAALLIGIYGESTPMKTRAVRRFSAIAGVAIFVVAASGFTRGIQEVGSPAALVSTTYGRMVVLKFELLLALAVLGALNRYRHVAEASRDLRGIRRAGVFEVGIAVVALSVTSILSGTVPAHEAYASTQRNAAPAITSTEQGGTTFYTVTFSDQRTVQIYADPGTAGKNELHLTFFTAAGNEQPIERLVVAVKGTTISARRLSPGHFVLPVTLPTGQTELTVNADSQGRSIVLSLPIAIG